MLETRKIAESIVEKLEKYNKLNRDIKRFFIFTTFQFHYTVKEDSIYVDVVNFDNEEEMLNNTSVGIETMVEINLKNIKEVAWAIKTIDRFIDRAEEDIQKARELAKPQVGILIYDEFTDSYLLNPTTGPILLKSKEISKQLAETKFDILGILLNLRNALVDTNFIGEIIGEENEEIIKKINDSMKNIQKAAKKIKGIEGIPRWELNFEAKEGMLLLTGYVTDHFSESTHNEEKINEVALKADIGILEEVEKVYNQVRAAEEMNKHMTDMARQLIVKNDPKLYVQDQATTNWLFTKEGKETLKNLDIIQFLNNDLSELGLDFG